jgi:hypothetical protein
MGLLTTKKTDTKKDIFAPASSFIEKVEYDPDGKTMDIHFHSGSKIRYIEVYPATFQSFKASPTHSAFYARAIKGNLQSVKIIDNSIGTQKSEPLKTIKKEEPLDTGFREQEARRKRIAGTVARAFADPSIGS